MGIAIGINTISKMFLGDTPVNKVYLGSNLVYELINKTKWIFASKENGRIASESYPSYASGAKAVFSVAYQGIIASLTIPAVDNTAGADQVVTIKIGDEVKLENTTWAVGTESEAYSYYKGTITWSYTKANMISCNYVEATT